MDVQDDDDVTLSAADERDLRLYFTLDRPAPPGSQSSLGGMCTRLGREINPKTTEVPTPLAVDADGNQTGAAWTEILACGKGLGPAADVEAALVAYVDARSGFKRVDRALARLSAEERGVLEAHYGEPEGQRIPLAVPALTPTAREENRSRAARDVYEPVSATIESLALRVADRRTAKPERATARAALRAIAEEATALLRGAKLTYRCARAVVQSCR